MPPVTPQSSLWSDPGPGICTASAVERWRNSSRTAGQQYAATHRDIRPLSVRCWTAVSRRLHGTTLVLGGCGVLYGAAWVVNALSTGRGATLVATLRHLVR